MSSNRHITTIPLNAIIIAAAFVLMLPLAMSEVLDAQRAAIGLKQYEQGLASAPIRESYAAEQAKSFTVGARIFGGVKVPKGSRPWQVALLRSWTASNLKAQFCGGSYVGPRVVVTAAHCVDEGTRKESVDVLIGTTDLSLGGSRVAVTSIVLEPKYNPKNYDHDIALLTIDITDVELTQLGRAVQEIEVLTEAQEKSYVISDQEVAATGWGRTEHGDLVVAELREVTLPIVLYDVCNDISGYSYTLTKSMVCAGRYSGGVDTCTGDSGGPLTLQIGNSAVLAGVTSAGARGACAQPGFYGVYTRTAPFRAWIYSAIGVKK